MISRVILGVVAATALSGSAQQQSPAPMVLLRDVRLIDGTGAPVREHVSLLLRDGRIEKIGEMGEMMVVPKGVPVRELSGKTVMPGLISAHSHLGLIVDDAESSATGYTRENVTAQLKQFERYGVTTIMSLGVNRDLVYELREEQRKGKLGGATILTAGRGIGVPGGAPGLPAAADKIYRPATAGEARKDVDELAAHHADIVKIWVDKGHGTMPEMTPEIYKAVIEEAHRERLRVAAHEYALEDAKQLVADGVDVLAHSVRDQVVDDVFVQSMKQYGVWYVPTFTVDESFFVYAGRPEFMKAKFFEDAAGSELLAKFDAPGVCGEGQSGPADRAASKRLRDWATEPEEAVRCRRECWVWYGLGCVAGQDSRVCGTSRAGVDGAGGADTDAGHYCGHGRECEAAAFNRSRDYCGGEAR